jgi:hypothetical protein
MADLRGGSTVGGYLILHQGMTTELLNAIKQVDGSGSGLDADLLDGHEASYFAPLASPAFTGTPTAPTVTAGDSSTKLATTAFVTSAIAGFDAVPSSFKEMNDQSATQMWIGTLAQYNAIGTKSADTIYYITDDVSNVLSNADTLDGLHASSFVTLASSPTFTGTVTAPTFVGALSGNASTATTLASARTIAGVSFNGSANIQIPFANLSSIPTTLSGYGITDAQAKVVITYN